MSGDIIEECHTVAPVIEFDCNTEICETNNFTEDIQTFQKTESESELNNTSTSNFKDTTDLEQYLSELLVGLQKQQEHQQNEVLQLIIQQRQELQNNPSSLNNNNNNINPPISINTLSPPIVSSAWTFTQGLIIGQVSVIILIVAFIKFFVFTEATPTQATKIPTKKDRSVIKTSKSDEIDLSRLKATPLTRLNAENNNNNNIPNNTPSVDDGTKLKDNLTHLKEVNKALNAGKVNLDFDSTLNSILEKTYYDVKTHKPESLDWFNVLVGQIIAQARLEALIDGNIYESLNKALNSPPVLQYFDAIKITEINIGDDYPIFSNCRVQNNEGRLEAKIDVDVSDTITLAVNTNLLINQPKFMSASLPINLAISVVRFSACLSVSLIATDDDDFNVEDNEHGNANNNVNKKKKAQNIDNNNHNTTDNSKGHSIALMFSFSPDFRLEFDIKSLIGSRAKLENIPRISSILENVIRKWFIERCIEPRFQLIQLPSLWPRKKTTRENVPTE